MAYLGSWKIDDLLTFHAMTHAAGTGALTDADAVPAYRIYEDETGTAILTGNTAKLDDANTTGFYSEQITLSAANGFEKGKCYVVYITAAVGSVTGGCYHTFQIEAEVDSNSVSNLNASVITATSIATDAITSVKIADGAIDAGALAADCITAAKLASDVTTELQSGLATAAALDAVDNFVDTEIAAIQSAIAALNNLSAAQVNAEVVDALATDTYAEPTAIPAATCSLEDKISFIYTYLRNKLETTSSTATLYRDDASTPIGTSAVSDNGTTFTKAEWS